MSAVRKVLVGAAVARSPAILAGLSRERIEALIQALIEHLDGLDGDADLEPSMGAVLCGDQHHWASGLGDDLEEPHDREADDEEACWWHDEGDQTSPDRFLRWVW